MTHDLVVIGAGPGGLSAARAGVRAGWRTALVAGGPIGGDCTHTGCIPSKTLIAAAASGVPAPEALARVRATVARVAATETADVLCAEGVDVVPGHARFLAPDVVEVVEREGTPHAGRTTTGTPRAPITLTASRVVIATGTSPRLTVVPGLDDALSTRSVFDLDDAPASLLVVGAGPSGCELAQAFARLGSRVTLVEQAPRVLPGVDADAAEVVAAALRRDGVTVRLGAAITGADVLAGDRVLVTTGRHPVTDDDGHDRAGVDLDTGGHVVVDEHLATTAPGVFAVGDVTGLCPSTHAADEMGRLAVRNAGRPRWRRRRFRADLVPRVVITDPEVATIGGDVGPDAWVAEVPLSRVDRAVTAGREDGFVRLVAGPPPGMGRLTRDGLHRLGGGRLLGATIVAPHAGEMIAEVALAMRIGALTGRLAQTVHAYPTWSLAVRQAAAALATTDPGVATVRPYREVPWA